MCVGGGWCIVDGVDFCILNFSIMSWSCRKSAAYV